MVNIEQLMQRVAAAGRSGASTEVHPGIFVNHPLMALSPKAAGWTLGNSRFNAVKGIVAGVRTRSVRAGMDAYRFTKRGKLGTILLAGDATKTDLLHEMAHAVHMQNPSHPFFREELARTPKLSSLLKDEDMRYGYAKMLKSQSKRTRKFTLESERLAFANEGSIGFLQRAEAAGLATYLSSSSHMAPGRSKSVIQGLRESGVAKAIRKIFTHFGSGWQGMEGYEVVWRRAYGDKGWLGTIKHEGNRIGFVQYEKASEGVATIKDVKLHGILTGVGSKAEREAAAAVYQGKGLGSEIYKAVAEHATEFTHLVPDIRGTTLEPAQRVWKSSKLAPAVEWAAGKPRADLAKLRQMGKSIIKSSEGKAVVNAGTAEIPSVLKATCRALKSL